MPLSELCRSQQRRCLTAAFWLPKRGRSLVQTVMLMVLLPLPPRTGTAWATASSAG